MQDSQQPRPSSLEREEEGIEVIIRIKPRTDEGSEQEFKKCVSLSPTEENTIIVETQNKKQYFSFDHIASEESTQQEIFDVVGHPVLQESFKVKKATQHDSTCHPYNAALFDSKKWQGFNCCIFAYGQTGAGKTYSILGNQNDIVEDHYAQSRGLLPRLLEELFLAGRRSNFSSVEVKCSYLEIYNEQIIDLLNKDLKDSSSKDVKVYPIREDHKRGVYVEGLSQQPIVSYEDALSYIIKGLKNRKIAATSMNSESSRSHTIFTISMKVELEEDGVSKTRVSKVHIVDLAGSERTKLAKVDGDRLKQGCSINKSLSSLGNVINSLVESIKKKKYIPFRDSKLTFFLKDSLGGNSKTKLLANINPRKAYLGDTISTLMFAKRAKIIKSRVEANQNIADNFQSLRSEIRKLREELAQTKFIQNGKERLAAPISFPVDSTASNYNYLPLDKYASSDTNIAGSLSSPAPTGGLQSREMQSFREKLIDFSITELEQPQQKLFKIFEDNEASYRNIISVYEQRLNTLNLTKPLRAENTKFKTLFEDKKTLEKACSNYANLVANFPAFTRIFTQNLELKKKFKIQENRRAEEKAAHESAQIEIENLKNNNKYLKNELEELRIEVCDLKQQLEEKNATIQQHLQKGSHKKDHTLYSHQYQSHNQHSSHHKIVDEAHPGSGKKLEIPLESINLSPTELRRRSTLCQKTKRDELKELLHRQNSMLEEYQIGISQIKTEFEHEIETLKTAYAELEYLYEAEKKEKQNIRKQKNKKELPPQVETLENENEYLKLNIMELETELAKIEEQEFKNQIALKTAYEESEKLKSELNSMHENGIAESELLDLINRLREIKQEADHQNQELQAARDKQQEIFKETRAKLMSCMKENCELIAKNQALTNNNQTLKRKMAEMLKLESENSVIINKESACWTTLEEGDFDEELFEKPTELAKEIDKLAAEKQELLKKQLELEHTNSEERAKLEKASSRILSLTKEVTLLKEEIKHEREESRRMVLRLEQLESQYSFVKDQQRLADIDYNRLRRSLEKYENLATRVRQQFNKQDLLEVVEEYKLLRARNQLLNQENQRLRTESLVIDRIKINNSKSQRTLPVVKELDPTTPRMREDQKFGKEDLRYTQTLRKEEPVTAQTKKRETYFGKKTSIHAADPITPVTPLTATTISKPGSSVPATTPHRAMGSYVSKELAGKLKFSSKDHK